MTFFKRKWVQESHWVFYLIGLPRKSVSLLFHRPTKKVSTKQSLNDPFEGRKSLNLLSMMSSIRLSDFLFHNLKASTSIQSNCISKWISLPVGWLKVNIGKTYDCHSKRSSWGFIIWDSDDRCIGGSSKPLIHLFSAKHAKLLTCQTAISHIIACSLSPLIVETDSLLVMQQLSSSTIPNFFNFLWWLEA